MKIDMYAGTGVFDQKAESVFNVHVDEIKAADQKSASEDADKSDT
ncbi:hypothetical protein [Desulfovibrio sp. UCD-KL4C]|nr:hypothetical protein [Desulfovibrio sp. UCD-KL4C]